MIRENFDDKHLENSADEEASRPNMQVPLDGLIRIQWYIRGTQAVQTGIKW